MTYSGKSHTVEDHARWWRPSARTWPCAARRRSRSGSGVVASYVHNQVAPGLGKIGVLVALESAGKNADELATFGRMVAMHVAAANPIALDLAGVPAEVLEREKGILARRTRASPRRCSRRSCSRASRPSPRRTACSSSPSSTTTPSRWRRPRKRPRARSVARSRSPRSFATRSARASSARTTTLPPRSPRPPAPGAR